MVNVLMLSIVFSTSQPKPSQKHWGALFLFQAPSAFVVYPLTFPQIVVKEDSTGDDNTLWGVGLLTPLLWYGTVWVIGKLSDKITYSMALASGFGGVGGAIHGLLLKGDANDIFLLSITENIGNYLLFYFNDLTVEHAVRWLVWNGIGGGFGLGLDIATKNIDKENAIMIAGITSMIGGYTSLLLPVKGFTAGDIWMEGGFAQSISYFGLALGSVVKDLEATGYLMAVGNLTGAALGYVLGKKRDIGFWEALGTTIGLASAVHLGVLGITVLGNIKDYRTVLVLSSTLTNLAVFGGYYLFSKPQNSVNSHAETSLNLYLNPLPILSGKYYKRLYFSTPLVYAAYRF